MNGPKIYYSAGEGLFAFKISQTVVSSFVVMLILCIAGYCLGKKLTKRPGRMQVLVEKGVTVLYNLVEDTMGKHNSHWTPYIGALFLSSMLGSLIGMTGILRTVTSDLSTTVTWAVITSVLVWYWTIKTNGIVSFLKGYINPLNIISDLAQPVSMAFRHFGNIMGGGVLMSLLYSALAAGSALVISLLRSNGIVIAVIVLALGAALFVLGLKKKKLFRKIFGIAFMAVAVCALLEEFGVVSGVPILTVGIPAILSVYFDVFSALVQALVFSLLTMVYVGNACPPPEEKETNN